MAKQTLTIEQKRVDIDIWIIVLVTLGTFAIYTITGNQLMNFVKNSEVAVWGCRYGYFLSLHFTKRKIFAIWIENKEYGESHNWNRFMFCTYYGLCLRIRTVSRLSTIQYNIGNKRCVVGRGSCFNHRYGNHYYGLGFL